MEERRVGALYPVDHTFAEDIVVYGSILNSLCSKIRQYNYSGLGIMYSWEVEAVVPVRAQNRPLSQAHRR
jgi:hypothetical protein